MQDNINENNSVSSLIDNLLKIILTANRNEFITWFFIGSVSTIMLLVIHI